MTGQGQGRRQFGVVEITAEVRAVNNRHLKIHTRLSDSLSSLEQRIESAVRQSLRRGSLQLNVQLSGGMNEGGYRLQEAVLAGYLQQCQSLAEKLGVPSHVEIQHLLVLPGVVGERRDSASEGELDEGLISAVLETVADALECLNRMRRAEGDSMAIELHRQLVSLDELTASIELRTPVVVEEYRSRLEGRLAQALLAIETQIQEADLIREVLVMADRTDVREEIVRLRSHISQFRGLLMGEESQGRKLDFLIQEMFRESNTIGAKASDSEIAQRVVDIKTIIEQMRELVQNVE
jgi:uncharacterized protein (TIGR00255 family)